MEENHENHEPQLDKYTKDKVDNGIKDLLEEKELKIAWRQQLEESDAVKNYLEGFHSASTNGFIQSYVTQKFFWYKYGDSFKESAERMRTKWINKAHSHIKTILQKKLFDLQCLWRANQIKLEEIEICYDFRVWGADIINCNFIEGITEDEIAMYQEYLLKPDTEPSSGRYFEWQDYDEIKDTDNDYCMMPDWYEFHNLRTGRGALLLLPDIKGKKEDFYMDLQRKKNRRDSPPEDPNIDKRPFIGNTYDNEFLKFFVTTFDDTDAKKWFNNYTSGKSMFSDDRMHFEELVGSMMEEKENIPIAAHHDFKQALQLAYNQYQCRKIAEHLPLAFEQYTFNKKMGFSVQPDKDMAENEIREIYAKGIIAGRKLNGEPPNFDF